MGESHSKALRQQPRPPEPAWRQTQNAWLQRATTRCAA